MMEYVRFGLAFVVVMAGTDRVEGGPPCLAEELLELIGRPLEIQSIPERDAGLKRAFAIAYSKFSQHVCDYPAIVQYCLQHSPAAGPKKAACELYQATPNALNQTGPLVGRFIENIGLGMLPHVILSSDVISVSDGAIPKVIFELPGGFGLALEKLRTIIHFCQSLIYPHGTYVGKVGCTALKVPERSSDASSSDASSNGASPNGASTSGHTQAMTNEMREMALD